MLQPHYGTWKSTVLWAKICQVETVSQHSAQKSPQGICFIHAVNICNDPKCSTANLQTYLHQWGTCVVLIIRGCCCVCKHRRSSLFKIWEVCARQMDNGVYSDTHIVFILVNLLSHLLLLISKCSFWIKIPHKSGKQKTMLIYAFLAKQIQLKQMNKGFFSCWMFCFF